MESSVNECTYMHKRFRARCQATELKLKFLTLQITFPDPNNNKLGETEETKSYKKSQHSANIGDQGLKGESLLLPL